MVLKRGWVGTFFVERWVKKLCSGQGVECGENAGKDA